MRHNTSRVGHPSTIHVHTKSLTNYRLGKSVAAENSYDGKVYNPDAKSFDRLPHRR